MTAPTMHDEALRICRDHIKAIHANERIVYGEEAAARFYEQIAQEMAPIVHYNGWCGEERAYHVARENVLRSFTISGIERSHRHSARVDLRVLLSCAAQDSFGDEVVFEEHRTVNEATQSAILHGVDFTLTTLPRSHK